MVMKDADEHQALKFDIKTHSKWNKPSLSSAYTHKQTYRKREQEGERYTHIHTYTLNEMYWLSSME